MSKKDKTQDIIDELNEMEKKMLSDVYGDFFDPGDTSSDIKLEINKPGDGKTGQGVPGSSKPRRSLFGSSKSGSDKPGKDIPRDPFTGGPLPDDVLADARDALNEFYDKVNEAEKKGVIPPQKDAGKKPEEQTAEATAEAQATAPPEPEEDPMETLDNLVGLTKIKHDVKELTAFAKVQKARKEAGLKSVPVSLHLVFTGNPGTGKTTVARIIGQLYKKIGVLSKGQMIEVDRSGLVAGYVGQTALKTQEQIQKALGGVLFIDEAYALSQKDDAFGQEAIETILKAMEDHRDDLVVIVAGYTVPMQKFIDSNPGLKSRFNKYIEFADYTIDELMAIFDLNCKKYDYKIEDDTRKHVREMIVAKKLETDENFANAREVRNLFEEIITNQARRVSTLEAPTQEDMMTILPEDLIDTELAEAEAVAAKAEAELRKAAENAAADASHVPTLEFPEASDKSDVPNPESDDSEEDIPEF